MAQRDGIKNLERSSEEIRQDIFEKLESLSKTVDQLGNRIHETFDWREQVARHPYVALGAAAGLGFLLSGLFKPAPSPGERIMDAIGETVEDIGNSLNASLKQSNHNGPDWITLAGMTALRAGMDLFFANVGKNKPGQNIPSKDEDYHATTHPTQAKHVF
jgi:hypothetical protein